jgi:uncharacterized membrane protein
MDAGGADAARAVLIGIAAAVITVAGVVFSITILALQLASQQFGPRMLRNFIRDLGTQVSLGAFVATFVYSILALGSVGNLGQSEFVPHISITAALALTLADLGVLIYFIHHVATSIQLTSVVAGIARDFRTTLNGLYEEEREAEPAPVDEDIEALRRRLRDDGAPVWARTSGFVQAVGHDRLVAIASSSNAVIGLTHRPGHFLAKDQTLAMVVPAEHVADVSNALNRAHILGSNRTLTQDLGFTVDQLVEVAIRALSPAVNDTFTALNCIDWLGDCLCRAAARPLPDGIYRDAGGTVRLVDPVLSFDRLVKGASDKIRQAGRGMPAVLIRQLENLEKIASVLGGGADAAVLTHQADMILRSSEESVSEPSDRDDVRAAYDALASKLARIGVSAR